MIQRIQSILLALIVVFMVASVFLPLYSKTEPKDGSSMLMTARSVQSLDAQGNVTSSESIMWVGAIAIVAAGIAGFSLFNYKNRKLQLMLGFGNTLVIAAFIFSIFYLSSDKIEHVIAKDGIGHRELGYYLPLISLILNFGANRLIRQDEALVKSMDRIR